MDRAENNAFARAYNDYAPIILKHIYFRVSNWEMAQDLTQETFFKTWQYISSANNQVRDYKKFLYMVANHLIIDHYRRKDKYPVSLESVSPKKTIVDPVQEKEMDINIEMETFKKYLGELKNHHQKIITYRYVDQLSITEISRLTGRSPNNISVIIHRGMKLLKNKIKNGNNKIVAE
ncbi:MAG: sigma-70 family RNA polymerase sigma factor [Patescibacteria group bacterium]|jgi:RNA polymerase sigma-70 factor (ECF subfamily)